MEWISIVGEFFVKLSPTMLLSLDGDSRLVYDLEIECARIGKARYTFDSPDEAIKQAPEIILYAQHTNQLIDQSDLHLL